MHGVTEPAEALRHAVACLQEGRDPRDLEGAKANALESIAWSLAGLLADKIEAAPSRETGLQQTLERAGLIDLRRKG